MIIICQIQGFIGLMGFFFLLVISLAWIFGFSVASMKAAKEEKERGEKMRYLFNF